MANEGGFNVIIEKVEVKNFSNAAKAFANAFGLEPGLTETMLRSTIPLMFITALDKKEVKAITPKLEELSKGGFEFRITSRESKIPRVNWLKRPRFTTLDLGKNEIAFDWQNSAFVCPTCGDSFVLQHVGKVPFVDAPPEGGESAGTPPPAAPAKKGASGPQIKVKIKPPTEKVDPEAEEPAPEPEAAKPLTDPQLEEESGASPAFGELSDVVPLDDLPPAKEATDVEAPVVQEGDAGPDAEAPTVEEEELALQPAGEGGEAYNVFVPEVKDAKKREEVVQLISKVRGCTPTDARKLTRRIMIPVAKNIPRKTAEKILEQFKRLKITGRMTKATRDG